ncbi:MAG: hypothetical protein V1835_01630 [Candidatus Micrarchaeota archaeon]
MAKCKKRWEEQEAELSLDGKSRRGQMAMWILTKFAMLFFIIALFSIIFIFERAERDVSCRMQVQQIADSIANRVHQVLNSPVEDEQRSYVFEMGIPLGKSDVATYLVNITSMEFTNGEKKLSIWVAPNGVPNCEGSAVVDYSDMAVFLNPPSRIAIVTKASYTARILAMRPSDRDANERSFYMMMIKCGEKCFPSRKYMFIQDCTRSDPKECFNFDTEDINNVCGFDVNCP